MMIGNTFSWGDEEGLSDIFITDVDEAGDTETEMDADNTQTEPPAIVCFEGQSCGPGSSAFAVLMFLPQCSPNLSSSTRRPTPKLLTPHPRTRRTTLFVTAFLILLGATVTET
jgi:hypothetical protein